MSRVINLLETFRKEKARPYRILIVDDEKTQHLAFTGTLGQNKRFLELIASESAHSVSEAVEAVDRKPFDLIIVDIDLSDPHRDGFDLIEIFRKKDMMPRICVHSNQAYVANYARIQQCGADCFISKPITLDNIHNQIIASIRKTPRETKKPLPSLKAFLIEDSLIFRKAWTIQNLVNVESFSSPEAFLDNLKGCSHRIEADLIVTDLHFDHSSDSGFQLASKIREIDSHIPIFLSTNGITDDEDLKRHRINATINKNVSLALVDIHNFFTNHHKDLVAEQDLLSKQKRRHDFMSVIYTIQSLNQFFDLGAYEDPQDRSEIRNGMKKQLKILHMESELSKSAQRDQTNPCEWDTPLSTLNHMTMLLSKEWPLAANEEAKIRNSLRTAETSLYELKSKLGI